MYAKKGIPVHFCEMDGDSSIWLIRTALGPKAVFLIQRVLNYSMVSITTRSPTVRPIPQNVPFRGIPSLVYLRVGTEFRLAPRFCAAKCLYGANAPPLRGEGGRTKRKTARRPMLCGRGRELFGLRPLLVFGLVRCSVSEFIVNNPAHPLTGIFPCATL